MKIVILDSFGVDPGDMDWRELQALGDCTFHDRTPAHLVVERAREIHRRRMPAHAPVIRRRSGLA